MQDEKTPKSISSKKIAANRRNAMLSTGPRTQAGKAQSRENSVRHGILVSSLLVTVGGDAESRTEFDDLLNALRQDRDPVGTLEESFVEKIAICYWRQKRALRWEAEIIARACLTRADAVDFESAPSGLGIFAEIKLKKITGHLSVLATEELDRVLRYETSIQRQLAYAINQLERLQRARKGEHVPAPVNVQLSSDQ